MSYEHGFGAKWLELLKEIAPTVKRARFPPFLHRVHSNKDLRFILTSRDYLLHQAQAQSGRLSTAAVNASEYTLNIEHYTRASKAQMLFNHIYFSDISVEERDALLYDDFFLKIIDHRNYNPRLIDLLTTADYVSISGRPIRAAVEAVLENPQELWEKPYRTHISDEGRALMLALFFSGGSTAIPALERAFERMTGAIGLEFVSADFPVKFRSALKELEGSVLAIQDRTVSFSNPGVRDFLERAVIEDRFLPAAIGAITEFAEVNHTWTFFCAQTPAPGAAHTAAAWARAAERLLKNDDGRALERLELIIDTYDRLQTQALLQVVRAAIRDFQDWEITDNETTRCQDVLEQIHQSVLPRDVLDETKRAISYAVAIMLTNSGGSLNLEDIKAVATSLFKFGDDESVAAEAARSALEGYIEDMSPELSEITSLDDLAGYERELKTLMMDYGVKNWKAARQIESRREELIEREERDYGEGYYGRQTASAQISDDQMRISDDQIRSMFRAVRGD
jgi:hypothetical protein